MDICYHMNGGVTWDEGWTMSGRHRNKIIEYINKKAEEKEAATTGKSKM